MFDLDQFVADCRGALAADKQPRSERLGDPEVIATWSELGKIPPGEIPGGIPRTVPSEIKGE